jgi:hypothetical protein
VVSLRIARALLALAARRWPARVRADVEREWLAEVDVLATQRRHARMLRFALSLAAARPPERPPLTALLPAAWRAVRLMILAPVIALVLMVAGVMLMNSVAILIPVNRWMDPQVPLATAGTLVCAVLLARLGDRWTLPGARIPLVLAVTVPGFAVVVAARYFIGGTKHLARHLPGHAIFFLGLAVLLFVVHRLATAGHTRRAWWIGVLGATVVADIAVIPPVLNAQIPPFETVHAGYAPVWLFTALTDSAFGLPHPTGSEKFMIATTTELNPLLFIVYAALALGAVVSAATGSLPLPRTAGQPN